MKIKVYHISMNHHGNTENLPLMATAYAKGVMHEPELALNCDDNIVNIIRYLYGMNCAA